MNNGDDEEMRADYDFHGGRRGRYAASYAKGTNITQVVGDAAERADKPASQILTSLQDLAHFIDELDLGQEFEARIKLSHSFEWARSQGMAELVVAIRCEEILIDFFTRANDLRASLVKSEAIFTADDKEYLTGRIRSTKSASLRAQYQYALAWSTKRFDLGQKAAINYARAIQEIAATTDLVARERNLRCLAPIAVSVAKKYRMGPVVFRELVGALESSAPLLVLEISSLLVPEPIENEDRRRIRDALFRVISAMAGTSLLDRMLDAARLGMRLDAKLGNADESPWNLALVEALKKTIAVGEHTLLQEEAAQHAAFILQKLGLVDERAEIVAIQQELARKNQPTWSHSEEIDADGSFAETIRKSLDDRISQFGEVGVLAYLGLSMNIMPQMKHARAALQQQREKGIGFFRQIADITLRSSDNRVIGHASAGSENEERAVIEQFGYACLFAWYAMDVTARQLISNGIVRKEHFDDLLSQTWIATQERGRPNDLPFLLGVPLTAYIDVIAGSQRSPVLVLLIDSLAMRLEAVLRKLARLHNVGDTREVQDSKGRLVTEVSGIFQVLNHPKVASVLGEDLDALARQTLLGEGEGLRHKIGHAITEVDDYNIFTAHKLVFLLLRLALLHGGTAGIAADKFQMPPDEA